MMQIDLLFQVLAGALHDLAGHTDHHRIRRDGLDHHRVRADPAARTDLDCAQDLCPGADHHVVAQSGVAFTLFEADTAQGDLVIKGDIIADLGSLADHDAHAVVDEETPADHRAGMDLNPGEPTGDL